MHSTGALWTDKEVRFTLRSRDAEAVDLCLFDEHDVPRESRTLSMARESEDGLWQVIVPGVPTGQLYGYRVTGPWDPSQGLRFNPAKLLLDPMSLAISGELSWHESLCGSEFRDGAEMRHPENSAAHTPRSVVVDRSFDWQGASAPKIPWNQTVIYECHVKGMTQLHSDIPVALRGTYLGLAHEAVIEHLLDFGITTVELLPVQHFVSEPHLQALGLRNYFGYNPIGWVAPHAPYASGDRGEQVSEFKGMVRALHSAGLEVVLDVVFNHTAEGNERGATLTHRGIDNRSFYLLAESDLRHYENYSGCGNTVDFGQPDVVEQTIGALRYWVDEMHVDGFRFDLAPVLGRQGGRFDPDAAFFRALRDDPVLSRIKLIAEPWDLGPEGYRLGRFPSPWHEWNDRFRDACRAFWRGDRVPKRELIRRLDGSQDLLHGSPSSASTSINFVTSHDGFTLRDLVSYEKKHNWDNGEQNQDGHSHNLSRNWGVEGPTNLPEIRSRRERTTRNLLATLLLSRGAPMLSHGDELGRTQGGNNNAYCQDGPVTWVDWQEASEQGELLGFVRHLTRLRRQLDLGTAGQDRWLSAHGDDLPALDVELRQELPIGWLRTHSAGTSLMILNGGDHGHLFELPDTDRPTPWQMVVNTARPGKRTLSGRAVRIPPHAVLFLVQAP